MKSYFLRMEAGCSTGSEQFNVLSKIKRIESSLQVFWWRSVYIFIIKNGESESKDINLSVDGDDGTPDFSRGSSQMVLNIISF